MIIILAKNALQHIDKKIKTATVSLNFTKTVLCVENASKVAKPVPIATTANNV